MWVTKKDIRELGGRYAEKCKTIDEFFSDSIREEQAKKTVEERLHRLEYDICVDSRMTFIDSYWIRRTSTVAWLSLLLNVVMGFIVWLKL